VNKYDLVVAIVSIPTLAVTVIALARMYFAQRAASPRGLAPETDARLARIEQAVDAIAVEVERISEAQRFSAKLLAEGRRPTDALATAEPREGRSRG
jgi:hypothetical protein